MRQRPRQEKADRAARASLPALSRLIDIIGGAVRRSYVKVLRQFTILLQGSRRPNSPEFRLPVTENTTTPSALSASSAEPHVV
jgi:hypothetical protein